MPEGTQGMEEPTQSRFHARWPDPALRPGSPAEGKRRLRIDFDSVGEREQVLAWLSEGLRPGRPGRLAREFPLLFLEGSCARHFWFGDRTGPSSFATLWPVSFRVGHTSLRAGLVSNVFTDPDQRGRGLSRALLQQAIQWAESRGIGLILLWSDLEAFYAPLGFDQAGEEGLVLADRLVMHRAAKSLADRRRLAVTPASLSDWSQIERLRHARFCELELPAGALGVQHAVPDLHVRVARDEHDIHGFAIRGRGDDLKEVIHEWGGSPAAALQCCQSLLDIRSNEDALFVLAAPGRDELGWSLRRAGAALIRQSLAWMRVASERSFARDLSRLLDLPFDLEMRDLGTQDPSLRVFELRSPTGACTVAQARLLEALFGHPERVPSSALQLDLRRVLGPGASARLPLPFHVAGLESI